MNKENTCERFKLLAKLCATEEDFLLIGDGTEMQTRFKDGYIMGINTLPTSWEVREIPTIDLINEAFGRIVDNCATHIHVENGVPMNQGTKDIITVQDFINGVKDGRVEINTKPPVVGPTAKDIEVLNTIAQRYKKIYRSAHGNVVVVAENGRKDYMTPFNHMFQFLKLSDGLMNIEQLRKTNVKTA